MLNYLFEKYVRLTVLAQICIVYIVGIYSLTNPASDSRILIFMTDLAIWGQSRVGKNK